jgi:hypothetical protein
MYCTVSSPAYATRSGKPGGEGSRPLESYHCFRFINHHHPHPPLRGRRCVAPAAKQKERKKRGEQRRSRGWPPSDTRMPPTCTCTCLRAAGGHPAEPPNHILPGPRARWTPIDPSTSRRGAVRSGAFPPDPDRCCLPPHVGLGPPTWRTRKPRAQQSTHRRVLLGRTESERRHNNL